MQNELLLALSLVISFSSLLIFHRFFGKSGIYVWIALCAVFANIEVTVLVRAFGLDQTLGNMLFASSFLATDMLSELYGKKDADKGVKIGIFTTALFIAFSLMWTRYIPAEGDFAMPAIKQLFSNTPRILIASLTAYTVSEFFDVRLYHAWWNLTERITGKRTTMLWFRNNFSTLLSQLLNIVMFNFGAFLGVYPMRELISLTLSCYLIYIATSLLDTPFLYLARRSFSRHTDKFYAV
ncbi:MAG: queuosine precursor transporter [Treponema sp.]